MAKAALFSIPLFILLGAALSACSSEDTSKAGEEGDGDSIGDGDSEAGGTFAGTGGGETGTGGAEAGTGGSTDGTGGAGPALEVRSQGCGQTPTTGERMISAADQMGNYIVSIPSDYNPIATYPVGFAFHGFGRTHLNCQSGDCAGFQSVMGQEAILIYMKSVGEGWEQPEVREDNVALFEAVLDSILEEACVDEARVFVAGTSSGAHFTNVLACRYGDRLLAAAPVAGYLPESDGCVGNVAALPIHGIDDPHVTFDSGETARDFYIAQNGCTTETIPELSAVHARIRASRDAMMTDWACVNYQGCDPGYPVRWCEHSQGGYDDSTHGWPSDGGLMIWDFVSNL